MLNAYSLAKDGDLRLSRNFSVREFACRDGSDPVFIDSDLVVLLQKVRDHFGRPVYIRSAFRTASHNKAVGGAAYSQHLYGKAADVHLSGVPAADLSAYAETLLPGTGGIGLYPAKGFVHLDVRPKKSRWNG